jgi:hypothetical protein
VCTPLLEDPCSKCANVLLGSFWYLVTARRSNTVLYEDRVQSQREKTTTKRRRRRKMKQEKKEKEKIRVTGSRSEIVIKNIYRKKR